MKIIKALNFEERYFIELNVKYQEITDKNLVEKYYHPSYINNDDVVHSILINLYRVNCVNEAVGSLSYSEKHSISLSVFVCKSVKSALLKEVLNEDRNIKGRVYPIGPIHEISKELYLEIQNSFHDIWDYDDKIVINNKLVDLLKYLSGFLNLEVGYNKIKIYHE